MATRAESAAATRAALLRATGDLLDEGGPDAVTLRAVGARAGVSRGAPYGHFTGRDDLLTALAADAWRRLADALVALQAGGDEAAAGASGGGERRAAAGRLKAALSLVLDVARRQPHLYALMFTVPDGDPRNLQDAAASAMAPFLALASETVGSADPRPVGALLMSTVLGISHMELAGQFETDKWDTSAEHVLEMLIGLISR